jgi:hypothetical protein
LNAIEEMLNSGIVTGVADKMKLNVAKGYLQRRPCKISSLRTVPPVFTGNADFAIRDL